MNTAHDLMEQLQGNGAHLYASSALATDHTRVVRKVRRDRAVRTSLLSVAGLAVAGAAAVGVANLRTAPLVPAATPTPPSAAPSTIVDATISVAKQERVEYIADDLAEAFGASRDEALDALVAALPPEADGNPEGWIVSGEYTVDGGDIQAAANSLVSTMTGHLEAFDVPRDQWRQTVVLASIIQQEAPTGRTDQAGVARVLLNRLDQGMLLQIESPLAYDLRADENLISDDGWAVDTPFNTYMYEGLPPSPIGTSTMEALDAAADPADGDWLYFLRKEDGNVLLFTTFEEFQAGLEEQGLPN